MWNPFPSIPPAQVAMDRMKKIKRQLSMTLRGGRSVDKTNGAPEQIGLDESGGGGGSDLGEAPTRTAPGEPRSGRGPLSSAPGRSTDCPCSQTGPQLCCLLAKFLLDLRYFHFPFTVFSPILSAPFLYCPSVPLSLALCPGLRGRKEGCPACHSCPMPPSALLLSSVTVPSGLLAPACLGPAFLGPLDASAAACPLAVGQPQSQLAAETGCSTR